MILFHQDLSVMPDAIRFKLVLHELVALLSVFEYEFLLHDIALAKEVTSPSELQSVIQVGI